MSYLSLSLPGGQTINAPAGIPTGGLANGTVTKIFSNAITIMIIFAVFMCLIFLAWGGFLWTTSSGDKAKIAAARARLTWSIVGLVVVLTAFGIVSLFSYFFNLKLFGF